MKRLTVLLLLLCFAFTGCSGRQLEEELLVIVMAVDETDGGDIRLTVKVPSNADAQKSHQDGYLLLEATGHGFSDALTLLNATVPRRLNFSQVREVVFGERAANSPGFSLLLQQLDAIPRFRCSATVIICQGDGSEFADAQKPYVGLRLSRFAETTLSTYAGKGFTPITSLCEGVRDLGYGFRDPLFVYGAINDFSSQIPQGDNALNALPGSLPRKSGDGMELFGAAATNGVSVCGYLTGYEMALIHLLEGNVHSMTVRQKEDVPLSLYACAPAALTADVSVSPAILRIRLQCEVRYPPGFPPELEPLRERLTRDIENTVIHLQGLRCDGLGFGNAAVRQFPTVQAWEALGWRDVYASARVELNLSLRAREE